MKSYCFGCRSGQLPFIQAARQSAFERDPRLGWALALLWQKCDFWDTHGIHPADTVLPRRGTTRFKRVLESVLRSDRWDRSVFSGPERRRRWSDEERRLILAEAFSPGACAAQVARRHDVSAGLVYAWRRKLVEMGREADDPALLAPGFVEATIVEDGEGISADRAPALSSTWRAASG